MTLNLDFKVTVKYVCTMHIDALSVLCAQLARDLLAIAKFLFCVFTVFLPKWRINFFT